MGYRPVTNVYGRNIVTENESDIRGGSPLSTNPEWLMPPEMRKNERIDPFF
jgi:hypothetical protein